MNRHGQPSCYFVYPDGYTEQAGAIMYLPSAIGEDDAIAEGSRVCARCALCVIGGKLQAAKVLAHIPTKINGIYTTTPDHTQPVPSMHVCVEDGYYANANDPTQQTRIGILQLGRGHDYSIPALAAFNHSLDTTHAAQMRMFGRLLPYMAMGGPAHLVRHTSYCI